MKNLFCRLFGHKTQEGMYSGAQYMQVLPTVVDGIGREHADLFARCRRCKELYSPGKVHLPKRTRELQLEWQIEKLKAQINEAYGKTS